MIIIIGGGITGLSAAFELSQRGVPFRLFEASERAGGLIWTEHVDGFTIDAGPDSVLAQKPAALELCDALDLTPRLMCTTPPRTAYVFKGGRLHALPSPSVLGIPTTIAGILGYDLLPWHARARLLMEPMVARQAPADESVAAFFRRRFGPATVDLVAAPLLGGIHAGDVERLSMRSVLPRFAYAEGQRGSVMRAPLRLKGDEARSGAFRSLPSGMSELVRAIEGRIPAGALEYRAPATALARDGHLWQVTAGGNTTAADAVILAVPAFVAARLLAPLGPEVASLCAEVPYASTASIALAWPRAAVRHPLDGSGFVVARRHSALRITACTWVSSKWSGRAPHGTVLLRAFLGGIHDPRAVDLDDAALVRVAAADISGVLGIDGPPILSRVYRFPHAGAQHNVGQTARAAAIDAALARHPGLLVAGSGFRSIGIPDCIADGRTVAGKAVEFCGVAL